MTTLAQSKAPPARLVASGGRMQPEAAQKPATDTIGTFVSLEIEARQCADLESLKFAIVNATRKLAGFDEAFLVEPGPLGAWRITHASGVHKLDRHVPLVQLLEGWLGRTAVNEGALSDAKLYDVVTDAEAFGLDARALRFPHALWLPIKGRSGAILAALVALKAETWRPQAMSLLIPLAGAYGHAWEALTPKRVTHRSRALGYLTRTRLAGGVMAGLALAAIVPVPLSSIAPAEVVAREPGSVTSPIDGVIADILVSPGVMVKKGTPLLTFVDVDLRNSWELARSRKAVAEAKHFKDVQSATATQKGIEEVAISKAELDVAASELAYAEELMRRTILKADRDGIVIYSSKSDWIGQPVKTGERIMELGNPQKTEIKIELPVSDALTLSQGGDVALFLDGDPMTAVAAKITRANYRPTVNPQSQLVYTVHAGFIEGSRRIGLRGVARVSTHDVPLGFYLLRRPIAALRQRFGL